MALGGLDSLWALIRLIFEKPTPPSIPWEPDENDTPIYVSVALIGLCLMFAYELFWGQDIVGSHFVENEWGRFFLWSAGLLTVYLVLYLTFRFAVNAWQKRRGRS